MLRGPFTFKVEARTILPKQEDRSASNYSWQSIKGEEMRMVVMMVICESADIQMNQSVPVLKKTQSSNNFVEISSTFYPHIIIFIKAIGC